MVLSAYNYIFAVGTVFAFLDAYNIGANDVANSFATSVSSKSLTMLQAMLIATVMELAGSVGVGARVADTIRTKVVNPNLFTEDPAVLMLGMCCAVLGSSLYLTMATKLGLPVSTTHSIMGGVIGMGIASVGWNRVSWGWNGVAQVFAAWGIAPGLAGAFGAIVFLITKYGVMRAKQPVKMAFISVPIYFTITASLIAMLLIWKGISGVKLNGAETAGAIIGTGVGVGVLVAVFFMPWLWRKLIMGDWQLKPWHILLGPFVLRRGEIPPPPEGYSGGVKDYYAGHATREELEARRAAQANDPEMAVSAPGMDDRVENGNMSGSDEASHGEKGSLQNGTTTGRAPVREAPVYKSLIGPKPEGKWYTGPVLFWWVKWAFLRGVDQDVVGNQKKKSILSGDLEAMHARATQYDNKAEYMYSFLQVMTAAAASFTHGANDVSNAVGPYATIYDIWQRGIIVAKSPVPIWILVFGGVSIVIGLWTYGYNIMRNLGNRLTLHSPSRGFSMELGSTITVIMATQLALPVSTTQCITGATVGVGLCNGDYKTINWRMVAWIYFGWFITLPVTALISGCMLGFVLHAPQWGNSIRSV